MGTGRRTCAYKACGSVETATFMARLKGSQGVLDMDRWFCSDQCRKRQRALDFNARRRSGLERERVFSRLSIGLVLLKQGRIDPQTLKLGLAKQRTSSGGRLGETLIKLGAITERELTLALAEQFRVPWIVLDESRVKQDALHLVPRDVVISSKSLPFDLDEREGRLSVVMADPGDRTVREMYKELVEHEVKFFVTDESLLVGLISRLCGPGAVRVDRSQALPGLTGCRPELRQAIDSILDDKLRSRVAGLRMETLGDSVRLKFNVCGVACNLTLDASKLTQQGASNANQ